jgi:hypothetical protein
MTHVRQVIDSGKMNCLCDVSPQEKVRGLLNPGIKRALATDPRFAVKSWVMDLVTGVQ